jgi:hypothetical protein
MKIPQNEIYPNINQSWGIVGIVILTMIIFSPIQIFLQGVLGNELSFLIYYLFSMGGAFLFIHFRRKKISRIASYNFTDSSYKVIGLVIVATVAIPFGVTLPIVNLLPMPEFIQKLFLEFGERKGLFSFIAIVIAAPIFEELIFRGIILDGLLRKYSPLKSIIISSLLFGLVHLNPWQFVGAFILGLFSSWVYYKTGKLTLSVIVHLVNNLIAFVGMLFSDSASYDKSLSEFYGGLTAMVLIILAAVTIFTVSVYLMRKTLNNSNKICWQQINKELSDKTDQTPDENINKIVN